MPLAKRTFVRSALTSAVFRTKVVSYLRVSMSSTGDVLARGCVTIRHVPYAGSELGLSSPIPKFLLQKKSNRTETAAAIITKILVKEP